MAGRPRKPKTDLAKRLISARESAGQTPEATAEACKVSAAALANYERGDNVPDAEFIRNFIKFTGAEAWFVLSGEISNPTRKRQLLAANDMVSIPRFDVRAAAGAGALALADDVSSYFSVERDWLRRKMPGWATTERAGILEIDGDSMEKTLWKGDLVVTFSDPPERVVDNGGIFVVLHHGHLRVKRLHVDMRSGDVSLISDNAKYPVEVVPRQYLEHDLRVLAMVSLRLGELRS